MSVHSCQLPSSRVKIVAESEDTPSAISGITVRIHPSAHSEPIPVPIDRRLSGTPFLARCLREKWEDETISETEY